MLPSASSRTDFTKGGLGRLIISMDCISMNKFVAGFGALNLDLIYEVDDLRAISTSHFRLEPGKE